MADKIKLPPMMSHPECHTYVWTDAEKAAIRARDIEVARVVLEAIGIWLENDEYGGWLVDELRAMEVFHG